MSIKLHVTSARAKRGTFSELTGSMSRAAGKKINRIITFSKKKPPLPGDPPSAPGQQDSTLRCGEATDRHSRDHVIVNAERDGAVAPLVCAGYLSVCVGGSWKERWCVVRAGSLHLQKEPGEQRSTVMVVPLRGAEVVPGGLGPRHPFSFCIRQAGTELAALEVTSGSIHDCVAQISLHCW